MPIPAANSIAAQDSVEYSGFSSSGPSGMRPYLENASTSSTKNSTTAIMVNTQPRLVMIQSSAVDDTSKTCSGASTPHRMNATTKPPTTVSMGLSTR